MHPKTLYLHSRGQPVRALQLLLKAYEPGLAVDGIFGPRTERAVRGAQRKLGLFPADGEAGSVTLAALAHAAQATQHPKPAQPPKPHQPVSFGAQASAVAHQAGAAIATAEHAVVATVEEAVAAIEKWIAGLHPEPKPVPPTLQHAVQRSKAKAQREPQPPGEVANPKVMRLSEPGRQFVFTHEGGGSPKAAHLHHPSPHSGVTLGPGYDMRKREAKDIERDLLGIGVDQTAAAAASKASHLFGDKADAFAQQNVGLITLSYQQQVALQNVYKKPYEDMVRTGVTVMLHQYEFDALVSYAGNTGGGWSPTIALVNQHKYLEAMAEIHKYVHSGGGVVQGLVNRRDAEAALFLYNNYHWMPAPTHHGHHKGG